MAHELRIEYIWSKCIAHTHTQNNNRTEINCDWCANKCCNELLSLSWCAFVVVVVVVELLQYVRHKSLCTNYSCMSMQCVFFSIIFTPIDRSMASIHASRHGFSGSFFVLARFSSFLSLFLLYFASYIDECCAKWWQMAIDSCWFEPRRKKKTNQ